MTSAEFRQKIKKGDFIEWQEVYNDHYYGTLRSEIDRIAGEGKTALFDVDVQGGINLKKIFGKDALAIFIMPPSVDELRERLLKRGTDSAEKIEMRIEKAASEILLADRFDCVIVNDGLEKECSEILEVVTEFIGTR
jgi:guanylate kinase